MQSSYFFGVRHCFFFFTLAATLWLSPLPQSFGAPFISEVMTNNKDALLDEDGAASDWIEIYNPDATTVDLSGWHLTDNSTKPLKWTFPAGVTLGSGEFKLIWASGKNRSSNLAQLHTNFSLSASGEYLALITPDGLARPAEFSPTLPLLQENESYGTPYTSTPLLGSGSASSALVPTDGSLANTWTQPAPIFTQSAAWTTGPLHVGFGLPTPGFFIEERLSNTPITTLASAEAVLNGTNASDRLTALVPQINFTGDTGTDGRFEDGRAFLHGGDQSNFALRATTTIVIPTAGLYTFQVNSDEGFGLNIDGARVLALNGLRTPFDSFVTLNLTAGEHSLILTYFENLEGEEVELSAAPGTQTSFSSFFKLIGDTANGGLPALAPAGVGTSLVATDLGTAMLGVNSSAYLRVPFNVADLASLGTLDFTIAYNDGFIAYLNGTEVARRNAPASATWNATASASRGRFESLLAESINLTTFRPLLTAGPNLLALHGLNSGSADSSFLLAPTLAGARPLLLAPQFFRIATPRAPNLNPGVLGHVADTSFLPKRGFYTTPQTVSLTTLTPGATLRYTTNGSIPSALNGTTYSVPISINNTTVLRAVALKEGFESSNVDTHTYAYLEDIVRQGGPSDPHRAKPTLEWPDPFFSNGQLMDYGMDRDILNSSNPLIGGSTKLKASLLALPSIFLSTSVPSLFDPNTGIYNHATKHGAEWERPASIEMIGDSQNPDGGFHSSCGIRIRGGYSRIAANPKHAFRVYFRNSYGNARLNYPIFGTAGTNQFDTFDLQCSQNYSWSFENDASHNALREIWSRDTQAAMGQPYSRGRFVHLYLNGVYWGLFQIEERKEAFFGESYLGGNKDNYDVIKHTGDSGGYSTEATDGYFVTQPDGTDAAWKKLWTASRAAYFINNDRSPLPPYGRLASTPQEKLAAYYLLESRAADGSPLNGTPALLNIDNLIDYIILLFFTNNADSSISDRLGNQKPNNFFCLRDRLGMGGFSSLIHDAEHSLDAYYATSRWGPWEKDTGNFWNNINYSNPQYLHQDLSASAEYRMRFADRLYRHLFNSGALSLEQSQARLDVRATQVESGIIAESARWGDALNGANISGIRTPRNANTWRAARTVTRDWFGPRQTTFLNEAIDKGFYSSIKPPVLNQRGGPVLSGFNVILTNPNSTPAASTIYYTTDGSDPRPLGGGLIPALLLPDSSHAFYLVPSLINGGSSLSIAQWTNVANPENQANWSNGPMGFGFNPTGRPASTDFTPFIATNVQALMQPAGKTASGTLYTRIPFTLTTAQINAFRAFRIKLRYDDAVVVYLNGKEVGRKILTSSFLPKWNSSSTTKHPDEEAILPEEINVADFRSLLVSGPNILSIHLLNSTSTDDDLLLSAAIEISTLGPLSAQVYTGPIPINTGTLIRSRILKDGIWSALEESVFYTDGVPASAANLVVSEFSYNPAGPIGAAEAPYSANDFEFIELQNISSTSVDLYNVKLSGAVTRSLSALVQSLVLLPGSRLVIPANQAAFTARYGSSMLSTGAFLGKLRNTNEPIRLTAANGMLIKEFGYSSKDPWPSGANGEGYSLVLINPNSNPDHAQAYNWRSSSGLNGNPTAAKGTTYAAWKTANGILSEDADPDQDGLVPLAEYALGGSPTQANFDLLPSPRIRPLTVGQNTASYLTISFTRRLAADDVIYDLESSPDLSSPWSATSSRLVSESNNRDGTATMVYRYSSPSASIPRNFLRLKLRLR